MVRRALIRGLMFEFNPANICSGSCIFRASHDKEEHCRSKREEDLEVIEPNINIIDPNSTTYIKAPAS